MEPLLDVKRLTDTDYVSNKYHELAMERDHIDSRIDELGESIGIDKLFLTQHEYLELAVLEIKADYLSTLVEKLKENPYCDIYKQMRSQYKAILAEDEPEKYKMQILELERMLGYYKYDTLEESLAAATADLKEALDEENIDPGRVHYISANVSDIRFKIQMIDNITD